MYKSIASLLDFASRLWTRLNAFLNLHNDRAVAAWGSSLQYKRRYTNPDDAKRARQEV
jgi:hypothetical protein